MRRSMSCSVTNPLVLRCTMQQRSDGLILVATMLDRKRGDGH
jgi:hypothetical protein